MTEIVGRDLTVGEAREFVEHVRTSVEDLKDWIVRAVKGRAWIALGYASWDAMCEAEFDGAVIRLPREDRREAVASLREAGLSTRAIGSALGVSPQTVVNDQLSNVGQSTTPETVTSLDGRQRPAIQTRRDPDPEPGSECDGLARDEKRPASEPGIWYSGPPDPHPGPTPLPERQADADAAVHRAERAASKPPLPELTPGVIEHIATDPAWQNQAYIAAFSKALTRGHDFMQFDPARLGRIGPGSMADELDSYLVGVEKFITAFRAARSGLRVIEGGH